MLRRFKRNYVFILKRLMSFCAVKTRTNLLIHHPRNRTCLILQALMKTLTIYMLSI